MSDPKKRKTPNESSNLPANKIGFEASDTEMEEAKTAFLDAYPVGSIFTIQHDNQQANECFIIKKTLEAYICPESAYGGKRRTRSSRKRSKRTVRKQRK